MGECLNRRRALRFGASRWRVKVFELVLVGEVSWSWRVEWQILFVKRHLCQLFCFFGIEFEEQSDAVGVGCGRLEAVCLINKRIEMRMGFHKIWRHRERII